MERLVYRKQNKGPFHVLERLINEDEQRNQKVRYSTAMVVETICSMGIDHFIFICNDWPNTKLPYKLDSDDNVLDVPQKHDLDL